MPYSPQTWTDTVATPLSAARLSYMETGIQTAQSTAESAGSGGSSSTSTTAAAQPKVSATTTRATITSSGITAVTVFLKASKANTATVFVGDVTVTSSGGGNVFTELAAGEGYTMDVASTSGIYVVAASGTQVVYVGVMQ